MNKTFGRLRVLILEDEPLIQMAMTVILEVEGHRVSTAEKAAGAIEIARLDQPNVAVLDLNLGTGKPDGVSAALAIMTVSPNTRIIYQTAHHDPLNWSAMMATMPEDILAKPVDEARLIRAVAGVAMPGVAA